MPRDGRGRVHTQVIIAPPALLRPDWPLAKATAAVRAYVAQDCVYALATKRAFERADHRIHRIRCERHIAVFANRSEFEHIIDSHGRVFSNLPGAGTLSPPPRAPQPTSDEFLTRRRLILNEDIVPWTTIEEVLSRPPFENIIAFSASEHVGAIAADKHVVPRAAIGYWIDDPGRKA